LQGVQPDWRAALAFYEVSSDRLVSVYDLPRKQLEHNDLNISVDRLPPRLVRKFFHPSAFFNHSGKRSIFSGLLHGSPFYEPESGDAEALRDLVPVANWQSCVCVPLADREDIMALLVIASERKNAFDSKVLGEIIPVKSMATMALAQNLYRDARQRSGVNDDRSARIAAAEFQERIRQLSEQTNELEKDNRQKTQKLDELIGEIEHLDKSSSQYKEELERVKGVLMTLEEQTSTTTQHLHTAYSELSLTQTRLSELEETVDFLREVFQVLSDKHEFETFSEMVVEWFARRFAAERCSLMVPDANDEALFILAQVGIDEEIASKVKVRVGQGISGWVAHNRKPLFVRIRDDAPEHGDAKPETYNSDSFISVPMVYNNRLCGVLNLSNKRAGCLFEHAEMERATMAASVLAVAFGGIEAVEERTKAA